MEESTHIAIEEEKKEEKRDKIIRRERGRTNSATLLEIWGVSPKSEEGGTRKRVRQEEEELIRDIFKRGNKIVCTSPKLEGKEKKKEDRMETEKAEKSTSKLILEEIRSMRSEIKEEIAFLNSRIIKMEKKWMERGKVMEDRMRRMEDKLKNLEIVRIAEEGKKKETEEEVKEVRRKLEKNWGEKIIL